MAPFRIRGHGLKRASAEAEQTQGAVDRGMALLARHDRDSRASGKPVALHVPSGVREHLVARRGQAHRVGPLGAGHEPERHVTGQTQKLNEPGPGDLLDEGGRRRRQVVVCRLVPADGEHVGCGRGVEGAPDDEAEIARTGRRDHRRLDRGDELVDDLARRGGAVRQPTPDRHPHGVQVDFREYRGLRGGLAVGRHVVSGSGEQSAQIGHGPHPRPHHAIPPTSSATQCAQRRTGTEAIARLPRQSTPQIRECHPGVLGASVPARPCGEALCRARGPTPRRRRFPATQARPEVGRTVVVSIPAVVDLATT